MSTTTQCETLADRFAKMRDAGLVDVKFYMRNLDEAATESVCAEVNDMYEALDRGEFSPLDFKDSYRG
ncbi:hypothetical protein [Maricaulis sp.]|uniref:hypothetical protein n=1 Tax=Maricaulis sp. TaxID=1486257 RepID=UPI003A902985